MPLNLGVYNFQSLSGNIATLAGKCLSDATCSCCLAVQRLNGSGRLDASDIVQPLGASSEVLV
jgi:hypothetical protein